jgi:hypothetical protein
MSTEKDMFLTEAVMNRKLYVTVTSQDIARTSTIPNMQDGKKNTVTVDVKEDMGVTTATDMIMIVTTTIRIAETKETVIIADKCCSTKACPQKG